MYMKLLYLLSMYMKLLYISYVTHEPCQNNNLLSRKGREKCVFLIVMISLLVKRNLNIQNV